MREGDCGREKTETERQGRAKEREREKMRKKDSTERRGERERERERERGGIERGGWGRENRYAKTQRTGADTIIQVTC